MPRWSWIGLLVVIVVACAANRPAPEEWQPEWDRAMAMIPELPAPGGSIGEGECEDTLAFLREEAARLVPAPNDVMDTAVEGWLAFARSLFFECPIETGEHAGWEAGYEELARFETEVSELLEEAAQP